MKKVLSLILSVCLCPMLIGQEYPQITDVPNRHITSLNGKWNIIIDPYENGFYDYRFEENPQGFFSNQKPVDKTDRVEYDFDKSETLNVPGDWNSQKPELLYYEGTVWYKKSFDYKLKPGKRLFLWFGAINYKSFVYLNGKRLGMHEGGFTPFNYEITGIVKEKDNYIVAKVDNKRLREGVPTINTDWWNYGGITRDVQLIEENENFVRDFCIHLKKGTNNTIEGNAVLDKIQIHDKIRLEIPELGISSTSQTDSTGKADFSFKAYPSLWSPENPRLYKVQFIYNDDTLSDKIGFRDIEAKGGEFVLNGTPLFLRGISIHEEVPLRMARANGPNDARLLLGWAKELGCNFVRLAHYPHNEAMTRTADSMGLMVWSEVPVYWTIQWENPATYKNAESQLTDNITRDKNRASIIIWSVGNETPLSDMRLKFMKKLVAQARRCDATRLISAALEVHRDQKYDTVYWVNDPLGEYLDVVACNEYVGWYDGLPMKTDRITWKTSYEKPFMFSEFGAEAPFGLHGDSLTRWSEEYQEYFYKQQIKMLKRIPFLRATTPWILADFRSPRRLLPGVQDGWNKKGLISTDGQKKKAFYVMKKWYEEIRLQKKNKP
jgi:beta-glucuronidase